MVLDDMRRKRRRDPTHSPVARALPWNGNVATAMAQIIAWSLGSKIAVLVAAGFVTVGGIWSIATIRVDILPDINQPTVTVFAESPGMASEEVERLILNPIESAVLGAPGVTRIRSNASYAQATVNMEFDWGTDTLRNRQIVQERLSQAILPQGVKPVLGPSTSLLGEIMWVGISSTNPDVTPMELRTLADWTVRPALLKVPGVANVLVMGGDVREWQIRLNAERMRRYNLMVDDVRMKVEGALVNKSGGVITEGERICHPSWLHRKGHRSGKHRGRQKRHGQAHRSSR